MREVARLTGFTLGYISGQIKCSANYGTKRYDNTLYGLTTKRINFG